MGVVGKELMNSILQNPRLAQALEAVVYKLCACMCNCIVVLFWTFICTQTTTPMTSTKGVSSPIGTRGHATTVNNEIIMNLFMNLFLVT